MTTFKMKNELTGVSIKIDNPDITEDMVVAAFRLATGKPQTTLPQFLSQSFTPHPNTPEAVIAPSEPVQQPKPTSKEVAVEIKKEQQGQPMDSILPPRPRQVKLIGSENTGSHSIGDIARFKDQTEREHVTVYINCPSCLHEGDRLTRKYGTFSVCPECETKLFNRYASEHPHETNEDGYTYLATSEMRFRDRNDDETTDKGRALSYA